MKKIQKVVKKQSIRKIKTKQQEVITEKHVLTEEDLAQNPHFATMGHVVGDTIEIAVGIKKEVSEKETVTEPVQMYKTKPVFKVETAVVNGKEYKKTITLDGCEYLDPIE